MESPSPDVTPAPNDEVERADRLPRTVRVLGWASFMNDVASEMIYPLLPTFLLQYLGASRTSLGVIEGVADTLSSLLKLWFGAISDRLRRRKSFVVMGYTAAALVRPFIGLAAYPWEVLAARAGDRAGKGIRSAPRDALIADCTTPGLRGRAFGYQRALDHLGAATGPIVAFVFLEFYPDALRTLFLLTVIPGLIVIVLVAWGIREAPQPPRHEEKHQTIGFRLRDFPRSFRFFLLATLIFAVGNSSDAFLMIRANEIGVPVVLLPLLWSVFHIVKSLGSFGAGGAVDRFGPRPVILGGWIVYAVLYAAFALADAPWEIWVMMSLYALFHALTEPAEKTLIANLVPAQWKGLAFGWFHFTVGIAALPASVVFGWLYDRFGAMAAFGWGAMLALTAVLILFGFVAPADVDAREKTSNNDAGRAGSS